MDIRKKSIEELQAELEFESEALATLQSIYADKVKQVRTNTLLPPDIQIRFLSEWETFYQQRLMVIFKKNLQPIKCEPIQEAAPVAEEQIAKEVSERKEVVKEDLETASAQESIDKDKPLDLSSFSNEVSLNTDSWMNAAESLEYDDIYSKDSDSTANHLIDSGSIVNEGYEAVMKGQEDDKFAATSGLKGLTSFMDFDLKKKRN